MECALVSCRDHRISSCRLVYSDLLQVLGFVHNRLSATAIIHLFLGLTISFMDKVRYGGQPENNPKKGSRQDGVLNSEPSEPSSFTGWIPPTLSRQIPPTEGKSSEALPDSPDSISLASLLLGLRKRENNNPVQIEGVVVAVSGWSDV